MAWDGTVASAYCNTCVDTKGQHQVFSGADETIVYSQLYVNLTVVACPGYNPDAAGQGVSASNSCGALTC